MNSVRFSRAIVITCLLAIMTAMTSTAARAQDREIPDPLKPWEGWATWNDRDRESPRLYSNPGERIPAWPSALNLSAEKESGKWSIDVVVFDETWITLPGTSETWPIDAKDGDDALAVVERAGRPSVRLAAGKHALSGAFRWDEMPQRIAVPAEVGIVKLTVEGKEVPLPVWDAQHQIWLKRKRTDEAEKDLLTVQVHRLIEDGIPTRLLTDIELTVSGKSREEELGWSLPAGFQLATITSPIPVAVDNRGRMKAQVRAGKWHVRAIAFRSQNVGKFEFAEAAEPIVNRELVGFKAKPDFRLAEIEGLTAVDVSQTTFPNDWRDATVYQWETNTAFQLTERLRGMGAQLAPGLTIKRQFWLEESGSSLTYRDQIQGKQQQLWRLDVAAGQDLGAVRIGGEGQLITENPQTGDEGFELRTRNLNVAAIGRVDGGLSGLSATGWQADAENLSAEFILPPGWRALAIFGADHVEGDWLTAWSLLDLFLLLIFALAIGRIWGVSVGLLAFVAFALAYHEPSSPRLTWLFLLMPIALLRVVPEGAAQRLVQLWKYLAVGCLLLTLIPFAASQIQETIYPQLETPGVKFAPRSGFWRAGSTRYRPSRVAVMPESNNAPVESIEPFSDNEPAEKSLRGMGSYVTPSRNSTQQQYHKKPKFNASNLLNDPRERIQTGPAEPQWRWNTVHCYWDGPVASDQTVRPVLIPMNVHRVLAALRVALLVLLAVILLDIRTLRLPSISSAALLLFVALICISPKSANADELPSQEMLQTLRKRLLEPPVGFPNAADVAAVELTVDGQRVIMKSEVHTSTKVAVPIPGRLTDWSPVSVQINEQPADLICRKDGYLWTVLPAGVHDVVVESRLPDVSEWEWTYLLKPRRVSITAPDWTVAGMGENQVPGQQLLFTKQQQTSAAASAYDRKDFQPMIVVDRYLEIGLVWQVRTEVSRLSAADRSASLRIPLLASESVLTSNVRVEDGAVIASLGNQQDKFTWVSELPVGPQIRLATRGTDSWIERWHLAISPVWNMSHAGLAPIFESGESELIPVWHPWPGEQATLTFAKPVAVQGETVTLQQVDHSIDLGTRQRTSKLKLDVECSLGSDFPITLSPDADVSSLKRAGQMVPVRRDGDRLIVPVRPGRQSIEIEWKRNVPLGFATRSGDVQLPVEGSNSTTIVKVPNSRWILWADGPLRGPAVRLWLILATAILIALILGSVPNSPLSRIEWALLAIGLTQVPLPAAIIVVGWLFALALRGRLDIEKMRWWRFDLFQLFLIGVTFVSLGIFIWIVGAGLLGSPETFIVGNQSSRYNLNWFQPRIGQQLTVTRVFTVSVWFYRLLMLVWALWLSAALLRWLKWGWLQFSEGGIWRNRPKVIKPDTTE